MLSDQAITAIVLISLVTNYLVAALADYLNLTHLDPGLPKEFSDVWDGQKYQRSQAYLKETTRLGILSSSLDLFALLAFWFCGGFQVLDQFARNQSSHAVLTGLIFIGTLAGLKFCLSLPLSIYSTFVIEERFGFNKTTPRTYLLDLVKTICLSLVLGGTILAAVIWFLTALGPLAWLLCWVVTSLFIIGIQYIVPTWILPLFNTFSPLEPGPLKNAILDYARSIDFPLSQILVMDGSKRSAKSNAFFVGFGKNRRIVLYDTLIQEQETQSLLAVLAHEMGHYKKRHIQRRLIMGICQMGVIFFLLSVFIRHQGLFSAFFVDEPSVHAGLIFFAILFSPIDMVLSVIMQFFSRRDEVAADEFAARTTQTPQALVKALKKLSAHNLSNLTPHPFYVFLNYSHPPVRERIQRLCPDEALG